ncbi:hypothetical protein [Sphingomonas phage Birtae]|nr:hypothetical protein [Sphingomonas phage Birtae]
MALTRQEEAAIRGAIARLERTAHCSPHIKELLNDSAMRSYLDTWVIGCLKPLLPGPGRDPALAAKRAQ